MIVGFALGAREAFIALKPGFGPEAAAVDPGGRRDAAGRQMCTDCEKPRGGHRRYLDAGFDLACVSQVGKDKAGCFDFYRREVLPRLDSSSPG